MQMINILTLFTFVIPNGLSSGSFKSSRK